MEQPNTSTIVATSGTQIIGANTVPLELSALLNDHVIPVFAKDNEPLISHLDFIDSVKECAELIYPSVTDLSIRGSHPIKGRIPEARHKPANELLPREKTVFMERMLFNWSVPTLVEDVGEQQLTFSIGGMKNYGADNLYAAKGSKQHFTLYAGFVVTVCSNLSVWTDGSCATVAVRSEEELKEEVYRLISGFDPSVLLRQLSDWTQIFVTERQFAQFIGKARLYSFLPKEQKGAVEPIELTDSQVGAVAKGFYHDANFKAQEGLISLFDLYQLLTGAIKSSYIDSFIPRHLNASQLILLLQQEIEGGSKSWYLG